MVVFDTQKDYALRSEIHVVITFGKLHREAFDMHPKCYCYHTSDMLRELNPTIVEDSSYINVGHARTGKSVSLHRIVHGCLIVSRHLASHN